MLPPEFRDTAVLGEADGRLMLTGFDDCVVGYPIDEWQDIESRLMQAKNQNRTMRNFLRLFLGSAQEVQIDKQGRILVPPSLREYGGLDKEVVLVGVGRKFEIWDRDRFEKSVMDQDFDDVSDAIAATGVEVSF
jgi:MraZ protein